MDGAVFWRALILDIGLALALILLGWLVASWVDRGASMLEKMALAFPIGSGLLTVVLFVLSILGAKLTLGLTSGVLALAIVAFGMVRVWKPSKMGSPDASPIAHVGRRRLWELLALLSLFLLFAATIAVSIGRSYSTWDAAAIWGVKGYGMARQGTIWAASEWGAYGLSYPLNIPLQISLFALLDGDIVPGSKLIFPLFYGSLALGLIAYWRREYGPITAALGSVLVMSIPIVFDHATQAYANLPFATYIVMGTLLAVEARTSGRRGPLALSGMAFGLAVWTRPEGLPLVALVYAGVFFACRSVGRPWKPGWVWVLPSFLVGGMWIAFASAHGGAGILPGLLGDARTSLSSGDLHLTAFYWIGRYLLRDMLRPSVWGLFLPVVAVGIVLHLRRSRLRFESQALMILAAAIAAGAFILAFYYLVSFTGDLNWWLDTGLSRMLLPGALLLAIWAVSACMNSFDPRVAATTEAGQPGVGAGGIDER